MSTVSHPKESEQYTAPMTVGLVPSDKLLICCEVGKNFASDLVLLLLCENWTVLLKLDWCDIFSLS